MTKVQSHVMLELYNVRTASSNVRKKKVKPNVRKVRSNVILVPPNVTIEPSFARKKIEPPNMTKGYTSKIEPPNRFFA